MILAIATHAVLCDILSTNSTSDQQRSQEKLVPCQRAALYHVRTNASASHEAGFQGCMYLAGIEEWK